MRHHLGRHFVSYVSTALLAASLVVVPASASAAPRTPNDPYFDEQWYLKKIHADEAWNNSLGFEGVPIAIIDTGVDITHPDLKDNIWTNPNEIPGNRIDDDLNGYVDDVHGWDFVGNDNNPSPDLDGPYEALAVNHGTIVAGIAAARGDNGTGVSGVTWQSTIMPLRVLNDSGLGNPDNILQAVEYAMHNGAKVINLSFVGSSQSELLNLAFKNAYDAGVLVVAAAGNAPSGGNAVNLDSKPLYPVCFDSGTSEDYVFGVGALDQAGQKAVFSNYGSNCIDIAAPGTRFISTKLFRPERDEFHEAYGGFFNGTSVAAPVVSGVAALLFALDRHLTPKQVMAAMVSTATDVSAIDPDYGKKLGAGSVDAAAAVAFILHNIESDHEPVARTDALVPGGSQGLIVTAAGSGRPPELRLFTKDGIFIRGWDAFPHEFRGGVSVATGRFGTTKEISIVAGAGTGGSPQVRIFNRDTEAIGGFLAFAKEFRGGVDVAVGDVNGDSMDDIVVAAGPGGGPHVRIFSAKGDAFGGFFAFEKTVRGGVDVAVGDVDGDGHNDIIAMTGRGAATRIRIFTGKGQFIREFRPFRTTTRGPSRIFAATLTAGSLADVLAAQGTGTLGIFDGGTGKQKATITGLRLPASSGTGDAAGPRLVVGAAQGKKPFVDVFLAAGDAVEFEAYEGSFLGGVNAAFLE